jgi:hypothetical protein
MSRWPVRIWPLVDERAANDVGVLLHCDYLAIEDDSRACGAEIANIVAQNERAAQDGENRKLTPILGVRLTTVANCAANDAHT